MSRVPFVVLGLFSTCLFAWIGILNWERGEDRSTAIHAVSMAGIGGAAAINMWAMVLRAREAETRSKQ